jgi:hypothetical protein
VAVVLASPPRESHFVGPEEHPCPASLGCHQL